MYLMMRVPFIPSIIVVAGFPVITRRSLVCADFALDFEKVMNKIPGFPTTGVTLVGYSMGFGVAQEMLIANPARYSNVVSLAGIGMYAEFVSASLMLSSGYRRTGVGC